ncbi:hypothetical protein HAP41_0000007270 [Bradyrhizobium barranii subsp. apii]|uniref:Uncharacterized protein n=1 Tax=Bradyrhizobium barranii subsp. apii TaxID=2819348 RepID=A0A8T5VMD1_9BRAD|nr:hypothetical protein [Bradyrhizobium barranii]UPT88808.1 hypothetical protein HAP41_0000007270 [Bradyrhizobium barranii subsp. apii]
MGDLRQLDFPELFEQRRMRRACSTSFSANFLTEKPLPCSGLIPKNFLAFAMVDEEKLVSGASDLTWRMTAKMSAIARSA